MLSFTVSLLLLRQSRPRKYRCHQIRTFAGMVYSGRANQLMLIIVPASFFVPPQILKLLFTHVHVSHATFLRALTISASLTLVHE